MKDLNDALKYMLGAPIIENTLMSVIDDGMKENSEFLEDANLGVEYERLYRGGSCEWCNNLAGTYTSENCPKDFFRRHDNCHCIIKFRGIKIYNGMGRKPRGIKSLQPEERAARAKRLLTQSEGSGTIRLSGSIYIPKVSQATRHKLTDQLSKLTKEEKEKLNQYTGNLACTINFKLWHMGIEKGTRNYDDVMILDRALSKGVIPEDMTVIRKIDYRLLDVDFESIESLIGTRKVFKGYTSTSLGAIELAGRNATMIIRVRKGFKGALYIKSIASQKYKNQEEVLFKRNISYVIDKVITEGGENYIYATVTE